jgi:hypothetical protein
MQGFFNKYDPKGGDFLKNPQGLTLQRTKKQGITFAVE